MLRSLALVAAALMAVLALQPQTTDAAARRYPRVRQISRDRLACPKTDSACELDTETEPDIAVNPVHPGNVIGVFQMGRYSNGGAVDTGYATSFDGGRTWPIRAPAPGLTVGVSSAKSTGKGAPFERASDPVIAFDRKHHVALLASIAVSVAGCSVYCTSAVTVNRSTDNGRTFGPPVIVHEDDSDQSNPPVAFNDKAWIVVDNNPQSPYYGRAYAAWDRLRCVDPTCGEGSVPAEQPVEVSTSDDGGVTWSPVVDAVNEQPGVVHQDVGVQPVVLPNGHVVVIYPDVHAGAYSFEGELVWIRSTDGGATWSKPVIMTRVDPYPEENNGLRAPNIPSASASNRTGTIWVAWQDEQFGHGRNDIVLMSSKNEGSTWSAPMNATPNEMGLDHFSPAIVAVGRNLYLVYRVHPPVNARASSMVDVAFRVLRDGKTIRGPVSLFRSSDASDAATTTGHQLTFFGDYAGIAASSKAVFPIWCHSQKYAKTGDNPTNTHQRAYVTRMSR